MINSLIDHIQKIIALTTEEQTLLSRYVKQQEFSKKEHLLTQGQKKTALYFVVQGCLRMYFIKDNGTEQMVQFAIDNWWIADYTTLDQHKPAQFYIQAVEHSKVLILTQSAQEELLEKLPKLERYFRKILQRAYAASQMRLTYLFDLSAEEKYNHFNSRFPEFVQRVPQYMLASYLGFSAELLSRLRAKE
ncbi:Crp/Fnr family transcriptional regulator [Mucilaginibacter sp. Bleaf8]|uniref:Crp/Fnr family transcriptional regulator n=1 Tax=Mucilaginibacter sp. Bleaf8 TaxID=2834430 RepID=UPI001BCEDA5F|nr:Crp/Fnr family transcriptional regulator [Mucilaginibacter sp. Bleaf8]MBS7566347.1 Crp/Fnr family transcriptional regulator [Mucilaginibacter sp. Bleaf8]